MSKTYKYTFGKKSIKMDSLDVANKEYILRYCASEKSIPKEAININLIYGKTWEYGQQELFNNYTNLPFGYSYKIEKKNNVHPKRIIEFDLNFLQNNNYNNYNMMKSLDNFINYYNDEEFDKFNILKEKMLENNVKPEFRHKNIILDGYDTDDSIKIIRNYNRINKIK